MKNELALEKQEALPMESPRKLTSLDILEAIVKGGIEGDKVFLVKEIVAMRREEEAEQAKKAFMADYFELSKALPVIYADKEVRTKSGALAFEYCSPQEIWDVLKPLLSKYHFATMSGQQEHDGRVTVTVTLIHERGHSESRSFTVRVSPGNALMSPSQCDAGASTSAERHAVIKMFGLRTRIRPDDDPRNEGTFITPEQAAELQRRVKDLNSNELGFMNLAGIKGIAGPVTIDHYKSILSGKYDVLDAVLQAKEKAGR